MSISSLSLANASRASIQRIQTQLRDANVELTTGRHADVGTALGRMTGNSISYRAQESSISRLLDSNKLVKNRMDLMDDTLSAVSDTADSFSSALLTGVATSVGTKTLVTVAAGNLDQLVASGNLNSGGQYMFAGTMSDVKPLNNALATVAANFATFKAAADADAVAAGGTAGLTEDNLKAYLSSAGYEAADGTIYRFDDQFDDASWSANWSNTDDSAASARISLTETMTTSLNANGAAFRKTVAAYAMVAGFGLEAMSGDLPKIVAGEAAKRLAAGKDQVTQLKSELGSRGARLDKANSVLTRQQDLVKQAYMRLEGVDETEAGLRLQALTTQLDTSYAVTSRLQGLSLLNYL